MMNKPEVCRAYWRFYREDVPDIPFATAGHARTLDENKRDTADRALLTRHVRHHGDAVAIVVARDELTAEKAAQLVSIEWQELPVITTPEAALAEDAAPIHNGGNLLKQSTMSTGNVQQTIDAADYGTGALSDPRYSTLSHGKRNIAGVDGG